MFSWLQQFFNDGNNNAQPQPQPLPLQTSDEDPHLANYSLHNTTSETDQRSTENFSTPDGRYRVFISHAGEDKHTIAYPLYSHLVALGVRAFLDQAEMKVGAYASDQMNHAMDEADIGVIILSREFAAKPWPIAELEHFLERMRVSESRDLCPLIIPVFYRLSVLECCSRDDIFQHYRESDGKNPFIEFGFYQRVQQGITSEDKVLRAFNSVSRITGVVNDKHATNKDTRAEKVKRELFVGKVVDNVMLALRERGNSPNITRLLFPCPDTPAAKTACMVTSPILLDISDATTSEGRVHRALLRIEKQRKLTLVLHGASGVGKSVILRSIAWDPQVKAKFPDAVLSVTLGTDVDQAQLCSAVSAALRQAGERALACEVGRQTDEDMIASVLDKFLAGKRALLIVDDVGFPGGPGALFLHALSTAVAARRGCALLAATQHTHFESLGMNLEMTSKQARHASARRILLAVARFSEDDVRRAGVSDCVLECLDQCAGLPLCLNILGQAVRAKVDACRGNLRLALPQFVDALKAEPQHGVLLGQEGRDRHKGLSISFQASLRFLDDSKALPFQTPYPFSAMFRAMCVLQKQAKAPLNMLCNLWGLHDEEQAKVVAQTFADIGLAYIGVPHENADMTRVVSLHDMALMFAIADAARMGESETWHKRLLAKYREAAGIADVVRGCHQWWTTRLYPDLYIHAHLCYHLQKAGDVAELLHVILHPAWALRQMDVSNASQLIEDVNRAIGMLHFQKQARQNLRRAPDATASVSVEFPRTLFSSIEDVPLCLPQDLRRPTRSTHITRRPRPQFEQLYKEEDRLREFLRLLKDALQLSFSFLADNPGEFSFQMYGRLFPLKNDDGTVRSYLRDLRAHARAPWLCCESACLNAPGGALRSILNVGVPITSLAVLPAQDKAVCACTNGDVCVVDVRRAVVVLVWRAHGTCVTGIAVASEAEARGGCDWCVTSSKDGSVRTWDVETGEEIKDPFQAHGKPVRCVALSPDGRLAVSASEGERSVYASVPSQTRRRPGVKKGSKVLLWRTETHEVLLQPDIAVDRDVDYACFDADGYKFAIGGITSKTEIHSVPQWSVADPEASNDAQVSVSRLDRSYTAASFSPVSDVVVCGTWDSSVKFYGYRQGQWRNEELQGHDEWITDIAFSPSGARFATASRDNTIRIWDARMYSGMFEPLRGHTEWVTGVAMKDESSVVSVSQDGTLRTWDVQASGRSQQSLFAPGEDISFLAMSPDGKRLVYGIFNYGFRIVEVQGCRPVRDVCSENTKQLWTAAFTPDGTRLVTVCLSGRVRVWEAEEFSELHDLGWFRGSGASVAISPDGKLAALSGDNWIYMYDLVACDGSKKQVGHCLHWTGVWFSLDGKRVIALARSGELCSFGQGAQEQWDVVSVGSPEVLRSLEEQHSGWGELARVLVDTDTIDKRDALDFIGEETIQESGIWPRGYSLLYGTVEDYKVLASFESPIRFFAHSRQHNSIFVVLGYEQMCLLKAQL